MALCYANVLYLKMVFVWVRLNWHRICRKLDFRKLFLLSQFQSPFKGFQSYPKGHLFLQTQEIEGNFSFAFTFCLEFGLPPPNLQSGDCVLFSLEF